MYTYIQSVRQFDLLRFYIVHYWSWAPLGMNSYWWMTRLQIRDDDTVTSKHIGLLPSCGQRLMTSANRANKSWRHLYLRRPQARRFLKPPPASTCIFLIASYFILWKKILLSHPYSSTVDYKDAALLLEYVANQACWGSLMTRHICRSTHCRGGANEWLILSRSMECVKTIEKAHATEIVVC